MEACLPLASRREAILIDRLASWRKLASESSIAMAALPFRPPPRRRAPPSIDIVDYAALAGPYWRGRSRTCGQPISLRRACRYFSYQLSRGDSPDERPRSSDAIFLALSDPTQSLETGSWRPCPILPSLSSAPRAEPSFPVAIRDGQEFPLFAHSIS